jgi:hypothetical protein
MENNPYSPVFIHFKLHTEVKGRFFSINRKASLNKRRTQTISYTSGTLGALMAFPPHPHMTRPASREPLEAYLRQQGLKPS